MHPRRVGSDAEAPLIRMLIQTLIDAPKTEGAPDSDTEDVPMTLTLEKNYHRRQVVDENGSVIEFIHRVTPGEW
jgi:hypothetical protein